MGIIAEIRNFSGTASRTVHITISDKSIFEIPKSDLFRL